MADSNELRFSTRVDLTGLKAGMAEVSGTISTQMAEAADSVASAAGSMQGSIGQMASASGGMVAAQAAVQEATASTTASVIEGVTAVQGAYTQLAQATLDNQAAQGALSIAYKEAGNLAQLSAKDMELLAWFQKEAAEAAQQLVLAKRQVAETLAYETAAVEVDIAATSADAAAKNSLTEATERLASVEGSASEGAAALEGAYAQVAQATLDNRAAQTALSQAYAEANGLEEMSAQQTQALALLQREAAEATEQLKLAKQQLGETLAYVNAETEVDISLNTRAAGAANLFASATERLSGAQSHSASSTAAASGAIREFEGHVPIRAVERFMATTLGLGPILEVAFPLVGLIAFGEMLWDVGEKAYKAYEAAEQAGTRIAKAWSDSNSAMAVVNDGLAVTNDKLENTLLKLEHKPENGLQLALDEARQSADQLAVSLQKDIDKSNDLIAKNQVSLFGKLLGKAGTDDAAKFVTETNQKLETIKNSYQETIDTAADGGATSSNIVEIKSAELARLQGVYANAEARMKPIIHALQQDLDMYQTSGGGRGQDVSGKLAIYQGYYAQLREEQRRLGEDFRKESLETQIAPLQAQAANTGTDNKAAQERLRAMELELTMLKQTHAVTLKEEHDFWTARVDEFNAGSQQFATVQGKITQLDTQGAAKASQAIAKYRAEAKKNDNLSDSGVERGLADMDAAVLKSSQNITQSGEKWRGYYAEVAKAGEVQASAGAAVDLANMRVMEQIGGLTQVQAAQITSGVHAAEYAAKIRVLTDELARLRAEQRLSPVTGQNLDAGNAKAQAAVQNQITQLQAQGQAAAITDQGATAAAVSAPFVRGFQTINGSWLNVQSQLIRGTRSISDAFANMGVDILTSVASSFEQMIVKAATSELRMLVLHAATNQGKVAADATAAGEAEGISALSALKQMSHAAAVAAGNTYAAVSAIPIIGPILAPPAAAAAYVGVMALAAFETGGIIPNTGVALVHKDESVLPAPLTNLLMDAAGRGSTSNSNSATMTQNNVFHGTTDSQFRAAMMRNGSTMMRTAQKQVRAMGRA